MRWDFSTIMVLFVVVSDLNEKQRADFAIAEGGVYVNAVRPGPAQSAGIRTGDTIVMLQNKQIRDRAHFEELVDGLPANKNVRILVHRDKNPLFLALKTPQ